MTIGKGIKKAALSRGKSRLKIGQGDNHAAGLAADFYFTIIFCV